MKTFAALLACLAAGGACAQWVGPTGAYSRIDYTTGNVYVGTAGYYNSLVRSDVVDTANTGRIITFHAYAGTPGSGERTTAIWGETNNPEGRALQGFNFASTGGGAGVWAETASDSGTGIHAKATATGGSNYGGYFEANGDDGTGVFGASNNGAGGYGGYFSAAGSFAMGVYGGATATGSTSSFGGYFMNPGTDGVGAEGRASATTGVGIGGLFICNSTGGTAVSARATASTGTTYALEATCTSASGYAGRFNGNVSITGTISKGGGSFKIDHPLDPENKYLYHSFVESPDMKNIYDGTVRTDAEGYATVTLPEWFDALNRDFRYQLTVLDESDGDWTMVKVVKKIQDHAFTIRSSSPNVEISWQVTGIRQDAFANEQRIPTEVEKEPWNKGRYLHPTAFGKPESLQTGREHENPALTAAPVLPKKKARFDPPLKPAVLGGR